MTPFEAFELYTALKLHFTKPGYDFHKYNGKTRLNSKSFEARTDKLFFMKLAKHQDPQGFLVANFLHNPKIWIRDLVYSQGAEDTYREWLKRQHSLTYLFKSDVSNLDEDFNANFRVVEAGQHPELLINYSAKLVSIETLCILVKMTGCASYWKKKLPYDPIVENTLDLIDKYHPFLHYDPLAVKKIIQDEFRIGAEA